MSVLFPSTRAPHLLLASGVEVPDDAVIGANVVIRAGVTLGRGVVLEDGVVLGKLPVLSARSLSPTPTLTATRVCDGAMVGSHVVVSVGAQIGTGAYVGDHTLVREGAILGPEASIGHGNTVSLNSRVGARSRSQGHCSIGAGVVVEEDCLLSPAVILLSGTSMGSGPGGPCTIRRGSRIGSGSQILPAVEVGADAIVGSGSVVIRDVPPGAVVAGVPARPMTRG